MKNTPVLGPQGEQLPDGHPSMYPPHPTGLNVGEQAETGVPHSCKLFSSYPTFPVIDFNNNLNEFVQLICFICSFQFDKGRYKTT